MNRRKSVAWRARPARKDDLAAWRLRKDGGDFPAFAIDSPDHKTLAVVATRELDIRPLRGVKGVAYLRSPPGRQD